MPLDISNLSVRASLSPASGNNRGGKEDEVARHKKMLQQMQTLLESMAPAIREDVNDRLNR